MEIAARPSRNQPFLRREKADGIERFVLVSAAQIAVLLRHALELDVKAIAGAPFRVILSGDTPGEVGPPEYVGAAGLSHPRVLHGIKTGGKATMLSVLKGIKEPRLEKGKVEMSIESPCTLSDPDYIQSVRWKLAGINSRQTSLSLRALVTPRDRAA